MSSRRTRSAMRYSDAPIPADYGARVRTERERVTRIIAWVVIGLVLASFAAPVLRSL